MSLLRRSYSYLFKILKPIKKSPIVRTRPKSRNQITSVQLVVPNPSRGARFPKTICYSILFLRIHSLPRFVIENKMNNTQGIPIAIRPI